MGLITAGLTFVSALLGKNEAKKNRQQQAAQYEEQQTIAKEAAALPKLKDVTGASFSFGASDGEDVELVSGERRPALPTTGPGPTRVNTGTGRYTPGRGPRGGRYSLPTRLRLF